MEAKVIRNAPKGRVVKMSCGDESWEEPTFNAAVVVDGKRIASLFNSTLLCLAEGSIRAPFATDAQILEAVLNDEPIM